MNEEIEKIDIEILDAKAKLLALKTKSLELKRKSLAVNDRLTPSSTSKDVEEYKEKLDKLEERIEKTKVFFSVGKWLYSFEDESLEWSGETYKIFDYPESYEGSLKEFYFSCVNDITKVRLDEYSKRLRTENEEIEVNQSITTPLGRKKMLSFTSKPILNKNGEIIGVEGLVKDLTDEIEGGEALDNFFNLSYDLHCIAHPDRYFVKISPAWEKLLGYDEKEILSRSYMDFIHPDDLNVTDDAVDELKDLGSVFQFENRYVAKSGETVFLEWNCQVDLETNLTYCNAKDITKTKFDKEALLNDLSNKELLLREIHHRVKNNLQIISSLLSLQAGVNHDEDRILKLYQDSKNRIHSMAAIHEMFYKSEELDKIDFSEYLEKLVADLANTFNSKDKNISFAIIAKSVFVNLDTAIPLGLLINEVITNSMKHGVDAEGNVKISINMEEKENERLEIMIGDSGINSLDNILDQDLESLGIMLINSLVEQVDGEIEQLNEIDGTVFKLTLENKLAYKM
ncbi:PAS domain-containing sensor histidine kinase [Brumimicrobium oceani]|uniref:histidine kinase n=1 Tax=Brumimicrobium oceani TaxID=2100725 RepID=A0A2U2X375_9FLAO|nr:histidine kinase dimerization/phosphoacceptor domain -containing protein [Brumimicrobium oceani]PWH82220.1 hypothetical protein DIT68_14030 [Brumimicrobium oceani]